LGECTGFPVFLCFHPPPSHRSFTNAKASVSVHVSFELPRFFPIFFRCCPLWPLPPLPNPFFNADRPVILPSTHSTRNPQSPALNLCLFPFFYGRHTPYPAPYVFPPSYPRFFFSRHYCRCLSRSPYFFVYDAFVAPSSSHSSLPFRIPLFSIIRCL